MKSFNPTHFQTCHIRLVTKGNPEAATIAEIAYEAAPSLVTFAGELGGGDRDRQHSQKGCSHISDLGDYISGCGAHT